MVVIGTPGGRWRGRVAGALVLAAAAVGLQAAPAGAAAVTVTNGTVWRDTAGNRLDAHGGGVIKVRNYYYWFGESRNSDFTFRAVNVYRSKDLKNWEFRNTALRQSSAPELAVANIERPKVIYNKKTKRFVMWMHRENGKDYGEARAAVAVSATVDGDYTWKGSFRPLDQHMSRDITTFVDDDGAGYMVSAARENYDLNVYRLTDDYTAIASLVRTWPGDHREAPALFKRGGVYFMLTSGATGWNPNQQKYSTATNLAGPWTSWQNVGDSTTFRSQAAFVLPVVGTKATTYLYLGDRWGPGFGGTYEDSSYVWLPLTFPNATTVEMDGYDEIVVNKRTGVVKGIGPAYVNLVNRQSGTCADVVSGKTTDGAELILYTCGSVANQQWLLKDAGGGYVNVVARHSGKCADVSDESREDGAKVIQWTCGTGANQQWQRKDVGGGYVQLVARHSGKCLDVTGGATANGTRLVQNACGSAAGQQWQVRPR